MKQKYKLTVEQAVRERAVILSTLNSEEHYAATPTIAYGSANPFFVQLVPCICGCQPEAVSFGDMPRVVWKIKCNCNEQTRQFQHKWQASLDWNFRHVRHIALQDIPFFDIPSKYEEAVNYLTAIRNNLDLRIRLALLETYLVRNDPACTLKQLPGTAYRKRLQAYKEWARLALKVVKHKQYQDKKNQELNEGVQYDNLDHSDY